MSKEGFPTNEPGVYRPPEHVPQPGEKPSMTTEQTKAFLESHAVKPLSDWQPLQPLLYVLPEEVRSETYFKRTPLEKVPSIVRLYEVRELDLTQPANGQLALEKGLATYALLNNGQADYYAIDPETQKPVRVRSGGTVTTRSAPYYVVKENLFSANDELFPPQEPMPS